MLRIYDEFLEDETVLGLKPLAYKLHVSALIYCSKHLTDGVVSPKALRVLQILLEYQLKKWVDELVTSGLWLADGDGYRIRNYLEFNPSASTVKKERAAARKRMKDLREKRADERADEPSPERSPEHAAERAPERSPAVPNQSLPDLSLRSSKALGRLNIEDGQMRRLMVATGARNRESVDKLVRAIVAHRCGEREVAIAIEESTGPGVRDPLAVALSSLVKNSKRQEAVA